MAIANYASWSIDERGLDAHCDFVSPMGIHVNIHKDFAYLDDPAAWTKLRADNPPHIVAEIHAGMLCYKDLHMCSRTTPSGLFFLACWAFQPGVKVETAATWEYIHALYGIGKYAFEGNNYIGVTGEDIQAFYEWLDEQHEEYDAPLPYPRMRQHC